jgi:hypothetical protein
MIQVWREFQRFAGAFLREQGVGLSIDGRLYLDWILIRGAVVISREGLGDDPDAMGLAKRNLELLLETASGLSLPASESEEFFAGVPRRGARGRISASNLRGALRRLPPLWPFTTRRRDA